MIGMPTTAWSGCRRRILFETLSILSLAPNNRTKANAGVARRFQIRALMLTALAATFTLANGTEPAKLWLKTESFDHDPDWDAHNNRVIHPKPNTIVQDFGYSETAHAGKAAAEMGGQVWRASEPAFYADKIGPRTLNDE